MTPLNTPQEFVLIYQGLVVADEIQMWDIMTKTWIRSVTANDGGPLNPGIKYRVKPEPVMIWVHRYDDDSALIYWSEASSRANRDGVTHVIPVQIDDTYQTFKV
jgi:hypothetical protein